MIFCPLPLFSLHDHICVTLGDKSTESIKQHHFIRFIIWVFLNKFHIFLFVFGDLLCSCYGCAFLLVFFSLPGHFPYKMCSRGHWRPSEDEKLKELVEKHGPHNWNVIAEKLPGRSGSIAINIEVLHLFVGKWLIYTQPFLYASSIFYLRYYKRSSLKKISYSKSRNNGCNVIYRSFYYFSMEFYSKGDASLTWIICVFRFVI